MTLEFSRQEQDAIPVEVVAQSGLDAALSALPEHHAAWARANGFAAKLGEVALLPGQDGSIARVLFGWGKAAARGRLQFPMARLPGKLPDGHYRLNPGDYDADTAALGWLLAGYAFKNYVDGDGAQTARLVAPDGVDAARIEAIANSVALTRDLINIPTSDMGPDNLEAAFRTLADEFGAECAVTKGAALLTENFPMIHAVGRASDQEPRLLDLRWGDKNAPRIALVGKGVCFDTGGLNIKPGNSMGLMKKDMGGAATAMGLARMIMARDLPVQLRLLVPAVENSISAGAFRPGDILHSRKGLTVEVNNTDAEGRLVLADALALADEERPELTVCLATLTGAARVALGPEVMPFYSDQDDLADELAQAGARVADPLWRMPFWNGYEAMIEPGIADLDNAPAGAFGGSITAALFLRRFVENAAAFAHFDIYGWTPTAKPGRPKGGECQAARALFEVIESRYGG